MFYVFSEIFTIITSKSKRDRRRVLKYAFLIFLAGLKIIKSIGKCGTVLKWNAGCYEALNID